MLDTQKRTDFGGEVIGDKTRAPQPEAKSDDLPEAGRPRQVSLDISITDQEVEAEKRREANSQLVVTDLPLVPFCDRARYLCREWEEERMTSRQLIFMVKRENLEVMSGRELIY